MRFGLIGSSLILLASAGWAAAQAPASLTPAPRLDPVPAGSPDDAHLSPWAGSGGGDDGKACAWGSVDYLLWWIKDDPLPPFLVLTGDPTTNNPGALNAGGRVVPGTSSVDFGALSGVRVSAGGWLDSDGTLGLEGSGFLLPQQGKTFRAASNANGNPVLGLRYIDTPGNATTPLAEDVFQASVPPGNPFGVGPFAGSVALISNTRLWGTELNAVAGLANSGGFRVQALVGFRYFDLSENLTLQIQANAIDGGAITFLGNSFPAPAGFVTTDFFSTRNQFYGGQVGFRDEYGLGNFVVGVTGKLALGSNHEVIQVLGTSTLNMPGAAPTTVPVGQFAGPSNIGRRTHDEFAVMPEVEVKVGYQVTNWLRASIGYDFLYLSRVVRPGSQADLLVNDSRNPVNGVFGMPPLDTTAFPRPFFNRTDFWAQGLTFSLEFRF
jgi:hypothetical protein